MQQVYKYQYFVNANEAVKWVGFSWEVGVRIITEAPSSGEAEWLVTEMATSGTVCFVPVLHAQSEVQKVPYFGLTKQHHSDLAVEGAVLQRGQCWL